MSKSKITRKKLKKIAEFCKNWKLTSEDKYKCLVNYRERRKLAST